MKPALHIEIERFDERVFVRLYDEGLSTGVNMWRPAKWELYLKALATEFEITTDMIDHNKERTEHGKS